MNLKLLLKLFVIINLVATLANVLSWAYITKEVSSTIQIFDTLFTYFVVNAGLLIGYTIIRIDNRKEGYSDENK